MSQIHEFKVDDMVFESYTNKYCKVLEAKDNILKLLALCYIDGEKLNGRGDIYRDTRYCTLADDAHFQKRVNVVMEVRKFILDHP